jgi:hypothetical protein
VIVRRQLAERHEPVAPERDARGLQLVLQIAPRGTGDQREHTMPLGEAGRDAREEIRTLDELGLVAVAPADAVLLK